MSSTVLENLRAGCIDLAVSARQSRETVEDRAKRFASFVGDDPLRLECLRLAIKTRGHEARIAAEALIDLAKDYVNFVRPDKPPVRKRGRPKKTDSSR